MPRLCRASVASLALLIPLALTACSDDSSPQPAASADAGAAATQAGPPSPVAQLDSLSGVSTSVAVDRPLLRVLSELTLLPGTVGAATFASGVIAFPITSGNATYFPPNSGVSPYVQGNIVHSGSGLRIAGRAAEVDLTDLVVDPGTSLVTGTVTVNGGVVATGAKFFILDGRTLRPLQVNKDQGTAVLAGTQALLHPDTAAVLRNAFSTDQFTDRLSIGTATITLALPDA